ncbi:MAG: L,D-transpeptidase family protein [Gemmatimonadetes bacterium]|nr:L,D-transpeptidase family protein [Gemmatimonadota bacterium]
MTTPTPSAPPPAPTGWSRVEQLLAGLIVLGLAGAGTLGWMVRGAEGELAGARKQLAEARASLKRAEASAGIYGDTSRAALQASEKSVPDTQPYIVVSIAENRLWYKLGDSVLFTTRVATGTGKTLKKPGGKEWKFETPRGRLKVEKKEVEPPWVPPDWHYIEMAKKKKLRIARLEKNKELKLTDGSVLTVVGNDVVRRTPTGDVLPYAVREGHEIVADGRLVIPPLGTNQRKYTGVLGAFRLYMGDGYGIHGTDVPSSIGTSASHGCVRLRNEDIETLYQIVKIGTPVFIY